MVSLCHATAVLRELLLHSVLSDSGQPRFPPALGAGSGRRGLLASSATHCCGRRQGAALSSSLGASCSCFPSLSGVKFHTSGQAFTSTAKRCCLAFFPASRKFKRLLCSSSRPEETASLPFPFAVRCCYAWCWGAVLAVLMSE